MCNLNFKSWSLSNRDRGHREYLNQKHTAIWRLFFLTISTNFLLQACEKFNEDKRCDNANWIRNPAFWLVGHSQIHGGNFKLIGHVTSPIDCRQKWPKNSWNCAKMLLRQKPSRTFFSYFRILKHRHSVTRIIKVLLMAVFCGTVFVNLLFLAHTG